MQIIQIDGCGGADAFRRPPAIISDQVKGMLIGKWVSKSICVMDKITRCAYFSYSWNANNRETLHTFTSSKKCYYLDVHLLSIYHFFSVHEFICVPFEDLNTVFYSLRKQGNPLCLRRNMSEIKIQSCETYGKFF